MGNTKIVLAPIGAGLVFFLLVCLYLIRLPHPKLQPKVKHMQKEQSTNMTISSTAFTHSTPIPSKYTCDGQNVNPPLKFDHIPQNAKSLVLIVDDPDAPMGTWTHWILFNISPAISLIPENSTPANAMEAPTSFGTPGYGGPCPPSGTHRYFFKLYALDEALDITNPTKQDIESSMSGHIISQAELIGLYSKQ